MYIITMYRHEYCASIYMCVIVLRIIGRIIVALDRFAFWSC